MTFSTWMNAKIDELGGIEKLYEKLPKVNPRAILAWKHELQMPNYRSQLLLCKALGCSLAEIRGALGLPHTHFAELLIAKIVPHGNIGDFPRKTDIDASTFEKWLSAGTLPSMAKWGQDSAALREVRDALILWGDETPKDVLMAQLTLACERTIADRNAAISAKMTKNCNSDKIAA